MSISSVFNAVFTINLILQYSSLSVDYDDTCHYSKCAVLESYFGSFCDHHRSHWTLCITRLPLTLMVTSPVQAGPGVVNGDDAGISTYSLIVALRPRPKSTFPLPPTPVCERLRTLGLWTRCRLLGSRPLELRYVYRHGCRAGRCVHRARPSPSSADHCLRLSSTPAAAAPRSTLVFGTLNIRSLLNKFDDVVEVRRDQHLDVLCLTETWHAPNSPVIGRLQGAGFSVIHRTRPRTVDDTSPNHGGVAVVAAPGLIISPLPSLSDQPTTFELVGAQDGRLSGVTWPEAGL